MDRRSMFKVASHGATGAGATRPTYILSPEGAVFATGSFPLLKKNSVTWPDYTLDYDPTTQEYAFWYVGIAQGAQFDGAALEVYSRFATSVTGTVGWIVTTRAVGQGTAWSATGVTTTITNGAIPGTACQVIRQAKTLTISGWAESKVIQVKIARNATGDSAAGDAKFGKAILRLTRSGV